MSLLHRDISDGMAKLDVCQEMLEETLAWLKPIVEDKQTASNDVPNQSDDEQTIADPDEWLEPQKSLIKTVIEGEDAESQQSAEKRKKALIKEIRERKIKLEVFKEDLKILATQLIEFRRELQRIQEYLRDVEPHFIKVQEVVNKMTKEVNDMNLAVFEQKPMIPIYRFEHFAKLQDLTISTSEIEKV